MLRVMGSLAAAVMLTAAPASAQIERIDVPPSRQSGLDMTLIDADAMPPEPELARRQRDDEVEGWSDAPLDPLAPVHPLYADLQKQLDQYRSKWSQLPQVRVGTGPAMSVGSTDPRVSALRERLGLSRAGRFDAALSSRISEYQKAHGLVADGKVSAQTIESLNKGAVYYEALIQLNMERARRLPTAASSGRYVLVDAGSARLWMYENGRPVDSMKVVVGSPETETPMMAAPLRFSSVNPYWNVPLELAQRLIAPNVLKGGLTYLSDRGYEVLDGWSDDAPVGDPRSVDWEGVARGDVKIRVRQLPGGANSMGEIKFMMPNQFGIYLHDTPNKALFNEEERWVSNGCVRVEDARRLARWLHGEMPQGASPRREEQVELDQPVPVYITYLTVGADSGGPVFRKDRYERDAAVLRRMNVGTGRMLDRDAEFREAMTLG